jgi:hypothetical protein
MNGDLEINGKDAYDTWRCGMGDNFLNTLLDVPPLKEFVENKGAAGNGKQVLYGEPYVDERNLTLTFTLVAPSPAELLAAKAEFERELLSIYGEPPVGTALRLPSILPDVYFRLTYLSSASFAFSGSRCACKISVRFNEPDPTNRNVPEPANRNVSGNACT